MTKSQEIIEQEQSQEIVVSEGMAIIQMIERIATNPDADVNKMQMILDVKLKVMGIEAKSAYTNSMTAAQSEMMPVSADASNPQTKSKYASYVKLDRAVRPIYTKHGFSLSFSEGETNKENHIRIVCIVSHNSGHDERHFADMPADGKGAKGGDVMTKTHAAGAAFAYGQRYLLKMVFNIAVGEFDDDGNSASGTVTEEQAQALEERIEKIADDKIKATKTICDFLGVSNLRAIPSSMHGKADGIVTDRENANANPSS